MTHCAVQWQHIIKKYIMKYIRKPLFGTEYQTVMKLHTSFIRRLDDRLAHCLIGYLDM